jgi:TolB-like protein/tetratricopeptide (TPR) repeat protein
MGQGPSFFSELRRRRVLRAGGIYLLSAVAAIEGSDFLFDSLGVAPTALRIVVALALLGLPITLAMAWLVEQTPDGLRWDRPPTQRPVRVRVHATLFVLAVSALSGVVAWSVYITPTPGEAHAGDAGEPSSGLAPRFEPTRLAVLYFDDHSPGGDLGYLADGLTEGLIHELSQIRPLAVISRNGVKPFRHGTTPLDSIAAALDVGTIVEGSVVRSGDRLRVVVQLIDAASGAHLASRVVERPWGDLLEVQDAVTDDVVFALRRRVGDHVRRVEGSRRASTAEAWLLVQRARELHETSDGRWAAGDTAGARIALDRADSLLALAAAGDPAWLAPLLARVDVDLARAAGRTLQYQTFDEPAVRRALRHLEQASAIAPDDPAVRARRGRAREILWDIHKDDTLAADAEADYRFAANAVPADALAAARLSELLRRQARFPESILYAERALEADAYLDEASAILVRLCHLSVELERFDDADRHCSEGLRRFPTHASLLEIQLLLLASDVGPRPDTLEAWRLARALDDALPPQRLEEWQPISLLYVATVFARAGEERRALELIDRAMIATTKSPDFHYYHAHALLELGQTDRALDALARYTAARPGEEGYLASDWWFRKIHDHPRFMAMVAREDR